MATQNALFAILTVAKPSVVEAKLQTVASWPHLNLNPGEWLLVAPAGTTTKEVCERVGIEAGQTTGLVVRIDTYFGLGPQSLWEWISTKRGAELGTPA